ncbi:MAG: hypothetical protein ABII88_00380 [Candidatus Omnitrophota bacterium]
MNKKLLQWFFTEEKIKEQTINANDECVELHPVQVISLIIVTIVFVFGVLLSENRWPMKVETLPSTPQEKIETKIEKNYFVNREDIINGDFSKKMAYWATADGGTIFSDSKSRMVTCDKDYVSAPYSLKIESIVPANRVYYIKKPQEKKIQNPYGFEECSNWLGVLPGAKINASLWYKGSVITVYLQYINKNGKWKTLDKIVGPVTDEWKKLELEKIAPADCRAICIEITLNQAQGMPLPAVLIDDVSLKVK